MARCCFCGSGFSPTDFAPRRSGLRLRNQRTRRPAGQHERDGAELVPRILRTESLGKRIEARELGHERRREILRDALRGALHRHRATAPYARLAHGVARRYALRHETLHERERVHVLGKLPDRQHRRLALAAQHVEDA